MRRMLLAGILVTALAGSAEALSIQDLIELSRAGLGEEVLLALIEVDRGVYAVDTATLKRLKAAGVSDRVIAALIRSGREVPEAVLPVTEAREPAQAPPPVVVIDHHDAERVREVPAPVAFPVYVPVVTRRHRSSLRAQDAAPTYQEAASYVPFGSPPRAAEPTHQPKHDPVYWGHGGKLRPDAWQPSPGDVRPHDRKK